MYYIYITGIYYGLPASGPWHAHIFNKNKLLDGSINILFVFDGLSLLLAIIYHFYAFAMR